MKVKYVGKTFGALSLTSGTVYKCIGVEMGMLRIIDDEEEDYLYSVPNPRPLDGSADGGHWEIVEDDEKGTLKNVFEQWGCIKYTNN